MPTITQLEYIIAVERLRSFSAAAQSCHISQPSLSMQIQKVEDEVGFLIFDRIKKPILPTEKGLRFIDQARAILREHAKLMQMSRTEETEVGGVFRFAMIPTLLPYVFPLFIESFSAKYPKVELKVDEMKTENIITSLHNDELDAGLLATPLHEAGLKENPIFFEPFYLYVSQNHPLAARKRIREDDLDAADMWLLQDGHCFRNQILKFCSTDSKRKIFKNVTFEGDNLETLRYLVKKSQGYTLIPHLFAANLSPQERRDHVREFEKPIPTREVSLVYRRDQWKGDVLKAIKEEIISHLPEELLEHNQKKQLILGISK